LDKSIFKQALLVFTLTAIKKAKTGLKNNNPCDVSNWLKDGGNVLIQDCKLIGGDAYGNVFKGSIKDTNYALKIKKLTTNLLKNPLNKNIETDVLVICSITN